jgi:hypothetical protein
MNLTVKGHTICSTFTGSLRKEKIMLNIRITILSVGLVFILAMGTIPAHAAPTVYIAACLDQEKPHALGIEGGLLSLLNARASTNPDPVAKIVSNEDYSLQIVSNGQTAYVAYMQTGCSSEIASSFPHD